MDNALTSFLLMLVIDSDAAAVFRSKDPNDAAKRQKLIDDAIPQLNDEAKLVLKNLDLNGIRTAINSTQSGNGPPQDQPMRRAAAKGRPAPAKGRRAPAKRPKKR